MDRLFRIIPVTTFMVIAVTLVTAVELLFLGGPIGLFQATPNFGPGWFLSMFSHSSWGHYTGNMLFFIPLSCILEMRYGSVKLALAIVVSGLFTGISCILGMHASVGLSGVVYMLLLMMFTMVNWRFMILIAIAAAVYWLLPELISVFRADGVDHLSHLLNGIGGLGLGFGYSKIETDK